MSRSYKPRVISSSNVDLKALLLAQGVIVATCLSTFVGARQLPPEPSASSPSASSSSLCSRAIANTLWGSAFAFFSLMADLWPVSETARIGSVFQGRSLRMRLISFFLCAPMYPLYGICVVSSHLSMTVRFRQIVTSSINPELAADTTSMFNKFRRYVDDILVIMFGIKQPRGFLKNTRMAANTHIVLGISGHTLPSTHLQSDYSVEEEIMADALTIGHKTAENSCLMELNEAGKLALLESRILPDYKQLRFLDGRSGIATIIISVQAIGYVTSIVYRAIHHLPVSPIEAIGFSYSMLVIFYSLVHILGAFSQYPLVIYLNRTQEQQMIYKCKSIRWSNADDLICRRTVVLGMVVVCSVVVVFTMLVEWQVLKIRSLDAIGPILFLLSLITQSLFIIIRWKCWTPYTGTNVIFFGCVMISLGGIVVSIVATILNWHTNKFDICTPSVIHNLPFLG